MMLMQCSTEIIIPDTVGLEVTNYTVANTVALTVTTKGGVSHHVDELKNLRNRITQEIMSHEGPED